jgi:hypothetical protein
MFAEGMKPAGHFFVNNVFDKIITSNKQAARIWLNAYRFFEFSQATEYAELLCCVLVSTKIKIFEQ